jgi:tetratricopeptide (TPR) repeat protein
LTLIWLGAALAAFPCAEPVSSARRSAEPLTALLAVEGCRTSAWHDGVGVELEAAGFPSAAAWHFSRCLAERDHLEPFCLAKLARVSRSTGDPTDLWVALDGAEPGDFRPEERDYLLLQLGRARADSGDLAGARRALEMVAPRSHWSQPARLLDARLQAALGDPWGAARAYAGLATGSRPWEAHYELARLYALGGRHEEAVAMFSRHPRDHALWEAAQLGAAKSWLALGEPRRARKILRSRGRWQRRYPEADVVFAEAACRSGRRSRGQRALTSDLSLPASSGPEATFAGWREDRLGLEDDLARRLLDETREALVAVVELEDELVRASSSPVRHHLETVLTSELRHREARAGERLLAALAGLAAELERANRGARELERQEVCG